MSMTIVVYPEVAVWHGAHCLWRVTGGGTYLWTHNGSDLPIAIPVGFPTDFASIPRGLWSLLPPFDSDYVEGAILHDFLYASHMVSKEDADLAFYDCLLTLKTPPWKREVLYYGVTFGGASSYHSGPQRWHQRVAVIRTLRSEGKIL